MPGVRESRLERIRAIVVSILGEQYPALLLTSIPETSVVEVARELKVGESHEAEVEFSEDGPQFESFEQMAKVRQMALNIHVG